MDTALVGTGATYLTDIPTDPLAADATVAAEYYLSQDATTDRITVCAPGAENSATISVTR
ncbi:MAG: hypothetical protein A2541_02610 [Candidatus Taylorbacteria bacterium RIFOXYD2_FULL_36_9]|uniref:Uncharacterized protein n=1 Tax=Candidatus Taylorbacteria bacterium RIFOXYD2_FULL_36_9 TaxID=1802338 RepID=A0A1G2PDE1_9BACT|nr:MAG: hypothetical protein A2541_02610 [Candidatus Taylorbacteria bacterium RIFOXYD2_FULL_36_9]